MIDLNKFAQDIADLADSGQMEMTFGFDATSWTHENIQTFADAAAAQTLGKTSRLKSVQVGNDVIALLGGANSDFVNARVEKGVVFVAVPESGKIELVFGP